MSEFRDVGLRRDIADYIEGHYRDRSEALAVADCILALPEIANGQALLSAKMDELDIGTGMIRITRVDPAHVFIEPGESASPVSQPQG